MAKKRARTPQPSAEPGVELADITPKEWQGIRELAVSIHKSGQSGKCMFKATVMAFVEWMLKQDTKVCFSETDGRMH